MTTPYYTITTLNVTTPYNSITKFTVATPFNVTDSSMHTMVPKLTINL